MTAKSYGGVIWTNHALKRLHDRGMTQKQAYRAFQYPDQEKKFGDGSFEYKKQVDGSVITIIAKKNDSRDWLIISCWADPPFSGSIDIIKKKRYHRYQNSGFWGKLWMHITRQLFGWEF